MQKLNYQIRPVLPGDAGAISALRRTVGVCENTMSLPSERLSRMESYVAEMGSNQHQMVAVTTQQDGSERLIGMAGLVVSENPRSRHVASLGIMVHPDFQGQGVGTAFIRMLLDLADNWLMLVRVELTVFVANPDAKRLYERMGFVEEGIRHKAAVRNGQYADLYEMARIHPNLCDSAPQ